MVFKEEDLEEKFLEKKINGLTKRKVIEKVMNKNNHKIGFICGIKGYLKNNFSLTF